METSIPLDILSNIKGARALQAVQSLFENLKGKDFKLEQSELIENNQTCTVEDLRADTIQQKSALEKQLIKQNFPASKADYLVVPKVLD